MALKGALTGGGPFGSLFGMGGAADAKNPAGGGIFGLALKGLGAFADGGLINGSGGSKSDNILARVSPGEFVVNAAATGNNIALLHAINSGKLPAFADGGLIGGGSVPTFPGGSGSTSRGGMTVHAPITINGSGTPEQNKDAAQQASKHIEDSVRRIWADEARRQLRPGGLLNQR